MKKNGWSVFSCVGKRRIPSTVPAQKRQDNYAFIAANHKMPVYDAARVVQWGKETQEVGTKKGYLECKPIKHKIKLLKKNSAGTTRFDPITDECYLPLSYFKDGYSELQICTKPRFFEGSQTEALGICRKSNSDLDNMLDPRTGQGVPCYGDSINIALAAKTVPVLHNEQPMARNIQRSIGRHTGID